jgi:hypothetical protein
VVQSPVAHWPLRNPAVEAGACHGGVEGARSTRCVVQPSCCTKPACSLLWMTCWCMAIRQITLVTYHLAEAHLECQRACCLLWQCTSIASHRYTSA